MNPSALLDNNLNGFVTRGGQFKCWFDCFVFIDLFAVLLEISNNAFYSWQKTELYGY
jgi:hypothetical protein